MAIHDAHDLIAAIDDHLADDARQLAATEAQAESVHAAFAGLLARLRLEIEVARGGTTGEHHLRG